MDERHNGSTLEKELLLLSSCKVWIAAKYEWKLLYVYRVENVNESGAFVGHGFGQCLCGHTPIVDHCVLKNEINGNTAIVGNVCVKKFLGIDAAKLFAGVKRIQNDIRAAPNEALIQYAYETGLVKSTGELMFLNDTKKRRVLSVLQRGWRADINNRLIDHFERCAARGKEKAATSAAQADH